MATRALIADGSPAVRESIRQHLECIGCDVVAEVETAAQALPLFRTIRPEIVALGVALTYGGQSTPIDLVRLIKRECPQTSVVMIEDGRPCVQRENFLGEGAIDCFALNRGRLSSLWRKLSLVHGELRKTDRVAILEPARVAIGSAAGKQLTPL